MRRKKLSFRMYRYVAGEQRVAEGEIRANRARQVAIDGFHITSKNVKLKLLVWPSIVFFISSLRGSIIFLVDRSIFHRVTENAFQRILLLTSVYS